MSDTLHKTADNVRVVPGMVLYCPEGHELRPAAPMQKRWECPHVNCYVDDLGDKHGYRYELAQCCSTHEAALSRVPKEETKS